MTVEVIQKLESDNSPIVPSSPLLKTTWITKSLL